MTAFAVCIFVLAYWLLVQVNGPPGRVGASTDGESLDAAAGTCGGDGGDCGD